MHGCLDIEMSLFVIRISFGKMRKTKIAGKMCLYKRLGMSFCASAVNQCLSLINTMAYVERQRNKRHL